MTSPPIRVRPARRYVKFQRLRWNAGSDAAPPVLLFTATLEMVVSTSISEAALSSAKNPRDIEKSIRAALYHELMKEFAR